MDISIINDELPIISADGSQSWYNNGKRHRVDGPAIIKANGYKAWYIDGKFHRVDGPARVGADGTQEWYVKGEYYRESHNGEPMPVIVKKDSISYDGTTYISIDDSEYEKYRYHPTGRFTKSARP